MTFPFARVTGSLSQIPVKVIGGRRVMYRQSKPATFRAILSKLWFHGKLSRTQAGKILLQVGENRSFLIRESESKPGEFSLSVRHNDSDQHFRIRRTDDGGYFITRRSVFSNLRDLVEHYKVVSDGLCTTLGEPCPKLEAVLSSTAKDQWEVSRDSIKLAKKLEASQFNDVWEGIWNGSTPVAVKTLKAGDLDSNGFLREAEVMKKLRHPKLVQLYAVCTDQMPYYIVMELVSNGTLLDYLRDLPDKGRVLRLPQFVDMAAQVAAGMAFLQAQNFVHRDLAARNVFVKENNICKVGDFRFLESANEDGVFTAREGEKFPVKWVAPEVALMNRFSAQSDVWSFGILLTELVTHGRIPYPGMSNAEVLQQVERGYRMPSPPGCPDELYQIMLDCWKANSNERPTFESLQWRLEDFFINSESGYNETA
eukprot:m.290719 g.290719  ORF g.290719 m.290719 type:complete len:425 (-) comp22951_c0_seq8:71-1345(-)